MVLRGVACVLRDVNGYVVTEVRVRVVRVRGDDKCGERVG